MKNDQVTFYDKLNDSIDFYKTGTNRLVVTAKEGGTIRQVYLTRDNAKDLVEYLQDYLRHTEYLETETDEKSTEEPVSALPDKPIDIPNGFELTGEYRRPLEGEYFLDDMGNAKRALMNFISPFWILREVQKEQSIFRDYRV